jgi:hypothetical protein
MLRIRAPRPSYWKTENLARFDGLRWTEPREVDLTMQEAAGRRVWPEWQASIHVRVRGMLTRQFIGAGTTLGIEHSPRIPIRNAAGTFRTGPRPLRPGHAYDAEVWTPRPSRKDLRRSSGNGPGWVWQYLRMDLPVAQGGPIERPPRSSAVQAPSPAQIAFPDYGSRRGPTLEPPGRDGKPRPAGAALRDSAYGGVYRLAQRLVAGTVTPYEYVERVLNHLSEGYTYSETPKRSAVPLAAFLLTDREGYCQQFSGAMALLLRMGGVPSRVATGFSPGTLDRDTGEYVVRDTDAHSWVEAYIAPYGWVTFDPTPPIGPARLAPAAGQTASLYGFAAPPGSTGASERTNDRGIDRGAADGGSPLPWIAGGVLAVVLLAAAGLLAWLRLGRRSAGPPVDEALRELRAALEGTGRRAAPDLTLHTMLRRYRNTPAEPYLRTLEAARFAGEDVAPTLEMRAALRRELSEGLSASARIGAWRAIPPASLRHSRSRKSYPDGR